MGNRENDETTEMVNYGQALEVLKRYFGYESFRQGQGELISAILDGQDVLGIMPTGAGKSICYQVPALILPGITLVVSPLISLMNDQVKALNQAGVHAAYINSSLTEAQISKALALAAQGRYKIVYVAPERLETSAFQEFVHQVDISMVTVDEAHCISQWGQDFRPSYLKIVQFINSLRNRPVVSAFTATATERVREDILCVLNLQNPRVLVTGFDRSNLYFGVETLGKKDDFVLSYIGAHTEESGIIYCATRKNVDKLYEILKNNNISVSRYHAGLGADERQKNQEDFIYDRTPVMVATNAFGMGIDKSNVRYVLHYNMPQSIENYYQEAGRAGRDGEYSECILLYSPQDVVINRFLLDSREPNPELTAEDNQAVREQDEKRLQTMIYYCQTTNCLRDYILKYFGEYGNNGNCSNCSSCNNEFEQVDVTDAALKIISCVREVRSRYGINVIAGILAGSDRAKLREYHVEVFEAFGALKEKSEPEIKRIIQFLLLEGYLEVTNDKYALIHLTEKSGLVAEEEKLVMKLPKLSVNKVTSKSAEKTSVKSFRKSDILNTRGMDLFEKLRALRMQIAKNENIPPYIVFSDKTLMDMCVKLPLTEEEMFTVNGVGQRKFDSYGVQFMQVIREFTGGSDEKLYFGDEQEVISPKKDSRKIPKAEFYLTKQQAEEFPYAEKYLVTEIAEKLSNLRDADTVKKVTGADIFRMMQAEGYASEGYVDGMRRKSVSPSGQEAGLFIGMRMSRKGTEYEDIYYSEKAQRMIVSRYIKREP